MPTKSILSLGDNVAPSVPTTPNHQAPSATRDTQKAVGQCLLQTEVLAASFNGEGFTIPINGTSTPIAIGGFNLSFTRVGNTFTLSATPRSPQTSPVEFRYGNTIYMLVSNAAISNNAQVIPTLGGTAIVGLSAAVLLVGGAYMNNRMRSAQKVTRRGFLNALGTMALVGGAASIASQDVEAANTTISSDAQGKYTIDNLPVVLGTPVKLSTPTVNKLDLSSGEDLTGKATPGSQVVIIEGQLVRTALVDANGNWALSGLSVGSHNITLRSTDTNPNSACIASDVSNMMTVNVAAINDPAPVAPANSPFANLGNMTVSDNQGNTPITINAGGVTDPLNRTITYSATGLPNDANGSLTINPSTGVISGTYDALGTGGSLTPFTILIRATPQNSLHSLTKSFILSIRNDG